jgi:DNA-directed RNA polymerase subunit RPC12/RpoP
MLRRRLPGLHGEEGRVSAILTTADEAFANWPTLDNAIGCANCSALFRQPDNWHCPHCGSEQLIPLAEMQRKRAESAAVVITAALLDHLRYFGRPAGRSGDERK